MVVDVVRLLCVKYVEECVGMLNLAPNSWQHLFHFYLFSSSAQSAIALKTFPYKDLANYFKDLSCYKWIHVPYRRDV